MDKYEVLKQYFGHNEFRSGQAELIDNIMSGRDAVGIMPTGAGKSVCYQIPALLLDGITVVISPLISLMKDQVSSLVQSGVPAAYINSSLTAAQNREVMRRAAGGAYKIIYAAPERLDTADFLEFSQHSRISMVTVDEAHCVSQWGQDFRPSYLKIKEYVTALPERPIVSAFTATATAAVKKDIETMLELHEPFSITTGFDRSNLYFEVRRPSRRMDELLSIMKENRGKSCIIYCSTRKNVELVCDTLCGEGFSATRYHAGLSDEERRENQDDFLYDRKNVMAATNAFGMGIDKSNVSLVIHFNMPKNLESYYQEAGRAGRDGEPASCILLYSGQDVRTHEFMIKKSSEENADEISDELRKELLKRDLERLKQMTFYSTTSHCLRSFILKYFGESGVDNCGHCSSCLEERVPTDISVDAQKIICCVARVKNAGRSIGKSLCSDILRGIDSEKIRNNSYEKLSTYGIMKGTPAQALRLELDYLVEQGFLLTSTGEYPTLLLGKNAAEVLRGERKLEIKLPKEKARHPAKQKSVSAPKSEPVEVDGELLAKLKALRMEFARKVKMPSYIIFTDASLRDMCRRLPLNESEFTEVSGVGRRKCQLYGEAFMKIIRAYVSK